MSDRPKRRVNYLKAAFANVYNLTALAGVSVAAIFTGEPWLFGVGVALEAVWMLFAPDNRRFQRAVDSRVAEQERLETLRQMQEQVALLPSEERQKVQGLSTRVAEVKGEVVRNRRLQGEFMEVQVRRLEDLVLEYIHLAVTSNKSEVYITRSDAKQINRERESWRRAAENAPDAGTRSLAQQNVAILEKRLAIAEDLSKFITRARGQMSLIQNTVALLRDQVMTMTTPEALTTQLDELVLSIDAMRETTREIDAVVAGTASFQPMSVDSNLAPETEFSGGVASTRSDRVRE